MAAISSAELIFPYEQDSFTLGVQVAGNGVSIAMNVLIDTRANRYVFLNTPLAIKLAHFFGVGALPLSQACRPALLGGMMVGWESP